MSSIFFYCHRSRLYKLPYQLVLIRWLFPLNFNISSSSLSWLSWLLVLVREANGVTDLIFIALLQCVYLNIFWPLSWLNSPALSNPLIILYCFQTFRAALSFIKLILFVFKQLLSVKVTDVYTNATKYFSGTSRFFFFQKADFSNFLLFL